MADKAPKSHHDHAPGVAFVRAGNRLVNLAHVVGVMLPVEGDPKQPLTLTLVTGDNLQLAGDDADAALEALSEFADCEPCEPPKPEPKAAAPKPPAPPAKKGE